MAAETLEPQHYDQLIEQYRIGDLSEKQWRRALRDYPDFKVYAEAEYNARQNPSMIKNPAAPEPAVGTEAEPE